MSLYDLDANNTITNRVIFRLLELCKNVVDGAIIRYGENNEAEIQVFEITGAYGLDYPQKIMAEVTGVNEVTFDRTVYGDAIIQDQQVTVFSEGVAVPLFDTGMEIVVNDLGELYVGDEFDIRLNSSSMTLLEVIPWKKAIGNRSYPYLAVIPERLPNVNSPNDRSTIDGQFVLQLWVDFAEMHEESSVIDLNELAGDVENEVMRDRRLRDINSGECLAIDTDFTDRVIFESEGNNDRAGYNLFLTVKYRHATNDTRKINP